MSLDTTKEELVTAICSATLDIADSMNEVCRDLDKFDRLRLIHDGLNDSDMDLESCHRFIAVLIMDRQEGYERDHPKG